MNEPLNTIFTRSSCRDFKSEALSSEDLQLIARAGLAAPSAMNVQPWHISMITAPEVLSALEAEALKNLQQANPAAYERLIGRGGTMFYHAPAIAIVWVNESYKPGAELLDCGIVTQNIALAAQSLDIASCICGLADFAFAGDKAAEFMAKCRAPEGFRFGMSVLLGRANSAKVPHDIDETKLTFV